MLLRMRADRMRPRIYHWLVSLPSAWWVAGNFLSFPWAIAYAIGYPLPWPWFPFALANLGFADSLIRTSENVHVVIDRAHAHDQPLPRRHRSPKAPETGRPLRLVQITDPHLGAFMSEAMLFAICERAVARDPDLILLTGDFLTVESNQDGDALRRALVPLRAFQGKTFACFGNHDHEAPEIVRQALVENGVRLLVDEATSVETPVGPVQIVGFDFRWQERERHLTDVCAAHPRVPGALRLLLLHDPGAFRQLPEGEGDLVLSGHTHGGQVGLVRLGLPYTVLSALSSIPDHGLWARGRDRLYVHRGTGHYGFPLRVGVPVEESVLHVYLDKA
jgi:predicted MPP superfamily phosphohydrolase